MNLPNKLTMLRIVLVPVFVVCFYLPINGAMYIAAAVFVIAYFTDLLDGHIARKRGLITDFGKLMDPLADKILVMSAMVCLVQEWMVPAAVVIVIIAREFLVTSLRLIAAPKGIVIAADGFGKMKTVLQMIWVAVTLLQMYLEEEFLIGYSVMPVLTAVLMWATLALTIISGGNYLWKNREVFRDR